MERLLTVALKAVREKWRQCDRALICNSNNRQRGVATLVFDQFVQVDSYFLNCSTSIRKAALRVLLSNSFVKLVFFE